MKWNIVLFESKRGEKPVEGFIRSLDKATIAKVTHAIDLLEMYGAYIGMPHTKKLSRELYELRIRGKQEIRIVYIFIHKNIYLLHAFSKKTQKTPRKELDIALGRVQLLTRR